MELESIKKGEYEYENHEDSRYNFSISYDEGIMPEHLLASASVPVNFDYTHVPTSSHDNRRGEYSAIDCKYNNIKKNNELGKKVTTRCCWDGGLLSNSPLREVISSHKLFWELQRETKLIHGINLAGEIALISQIYKYTLLIYGHQRKKKFRMIMTKFLIEKTTLLIKIRQIMIKRLLFL